MTYILDMLSDKRLDSLRAIIQGMAPADAETLLRVMARFSEASYRRGAQQGAAFCGYHGTELAKWRHNLPLHVSPMLDMRDGLPFITGERRRATETLGVEYADSLNRIGVYP